MTCITFNLNDHQMSHPPKKHLQNRPKQTGRPPKEFEQRFCLMLIEHMEKGLHFESFGALAGCGRNLLYEWVKDYPEFGDAKTKGEALSFKFWDQMGAALASGQMRRVTKRSPKVVKDKDGNDMVLTDAKGNVMYDEEFAPAVAAQAIWIFNMKNKFGWRDAKSLAISGDVNGAPIRIAPELSKEERMKEILEAEKVLRELDAVGVNGPTK